MLQRKNAQLEIIVRVSSSGNILRFPLVRCLMSPIDAFSSKKQD
ncbi:hypothetical protein GCM10008934_42150 [Virgibacillus salarius]